MKMLNYRTFRSNKEFREWQLDFDTEPMITQIMPWVSSIAMSGTEHRDYPTDLKHKTDMAGDTECGCFVVYITEE